MGEWKAPLSLRVKPDLRLRMEKLASREHRTLGNLGEILVEWATQKLEETGSVAELINRQVPIPRNPQGNYKRRV